MVLPLPHHGQLVLTLPPFLDPHRCVDAAHSHAKTCTPDPVNPWPPDIVGDGHPRPQQSRQDQRARVHGDVGEVQSGLLAVVPPELVDEELLVDEVLLVRLQVQRLHSLLANSPRYCVIELLLLHQYPRTAPKDTAAACQAFVAATAARTSVDGVFGSSRLLVTAAAAAAAVEVRTQDVHAASQHSERVEVPVPHTNPFVVGANSEG
mmetsp:Transcript_44431/g.87013  ORF Transcript_44431/g.87013 Transcript_44431/m.87013 type:complete len:207 (+) Transcript_44431:477-1097(+)